MKNNEMPFNRNDNIDEFFTYIKRIADESDRRFNDADESVCKLMIEKLKYCLTATSLLTSANSNVPNVSLHDISHISFSLKELLSQWNKKLSEKSNEPKAPNFSRYHLQVKNSSTTGRPCYELDIEQIKYLKELSFTWKSIALILGIHRTTLWRRLKKDHPNLLDSVYIDISEIELDNIIRDMKNKHPLSGERMLMGMLRSQSINVQRVRLRDSIHRVDPINTALRWIRKNPRWKYSVPGPNSLWHNDGLHKPIHWKIIIHACIDGYSRLITYLICTSNNFGTTVLDAFKNAVSKIWVSSKSSRRPWSGK